MKRPEVKNYSNNIDFSGNYLSDLEEYCDQLEKSLDMACEILEDGYGQEYANYEYITYDEKLINIPANMKAKQWYEFLMKEGK